LTNAQSGDEAAGINLAKSATVCQKDDNAEYPDKTELPCSPKTTDAIAKYEGSGSLSAYD
jgi:hypothetical protein